MAPSSPTESSTTITVDVSQWPTVAVSFPARYTRQDFDDYIRALGLLAHKGMRGLIIDTRVGPPPGPTQRAQLRDYVKTHWERLRSMRGVVFITNSAIARGTLTALSWLIPKPCPIAMVETRTDADRWLQEHAST